MIKYIFFILFSFFLIIIFYFSYFKNKEKKRSINNENLQEEQVNLLISKLGDYDKEILRLKELILIEFAESKASSRERFDYIDKSFIELNKIFYSNKRGILANQYLERLLEMILPKDNLVYQLEYTLQKKTEKQEGLRVDAIIFGPENKNNLAIDSKFPLDNYLLMIDKNKTTKERQQAQKDFRNDLKKHVQKTSQYLSEEDNIHQCVMFIPSDSIYLMINELRFYEIIEIALSKKVWICSPTTFYIVLNQIELVNRNWELHKNSIEIIKDYLVIAKEFTRFSERWKEINRGLLSYIKKANELGITVNKIIEKNSKLQEFWSKKNKKRKTE